MDLATAVSYHYGQFPPQQLDYGQLVEHLVLAADALGRYDQMLKNMHNSELLLAPLRNQEAVISSRMEGTVSTIDEILKFEANEGSTVDSANTRSEVFETLLYQRALTSTQRAIEEGQPLTQHLIRAAHARLLSWGRGAAKSPGKYKTQQNFLADRAKKNILFVPVSPEHLQQGMDELFQYMQNGSHVPLLKAAISHVEFEALHPFEDGNGRIGRMIITLLLWQAKVISQPHFYISGYMENNKDEYIDRMRSVSEHGDWTGWCKFFLQAVQNQAMQNLEVAEDIRRLYENMKVKFSDCLSSKWSVATLDFVFTNPIFRNNKFTATSGIPLTSASRFIKLLLDQSLLVTVEEASGRRPAMYAFEPLLKLVRV